MKTKQDPRRAEARRYLKKLIRPGATVYTVLRHVSASGMSRSIDLYIFRSGKIRRISASVGAILGYSSDRSHDGLRASGCGMDVGFEAVYYLGCNLFPRGFIPANAGRSMGRNGAPATERDPDGGYALNHEWI